MSDNHHEIKKHDVKVITVVFMIFCMCAAGAYGIEEMIPAAGPGLTIIMLLIIPMVWSFPMSMAAAELGAVRPREGGYYRWVQEALGEFWGFQAGWWKTVSNYIDNSLYIILAGNYLAYMIDLTDMQRYIFQIALILTFVFINLRGIKEVGLVSTLISILVIIVFTMLSIAGFTNIHFNPMVPFIPANQDLLSSIGNGLAIGIWMYGGYEAMSALAGEVKNPTVIPKGTMLALPLIITVYAIPTIAGLMSIGSWENWTTGGDGVGYATILTTYWGPIWGILFGGIAVLAQCSLYNSWMLAGSRVLFTMADDNLAPKLINKVNKRGVPYIPVILMGIVNIILCSFDFKVVLTVDVLLAVSTHVLIFTSMMILRRRIPDSERPLRIPGKYPLIVVMFSIPIMVALAVFLISGTDYFIGGLIGALSGPVCYFIFKRKYRGLYASNPNENPINPITRLAVGDTFRIAKFFAVTTVLAIMGSYFLPWYEASWGTAYYLETYGADIFSTMIKGINIFAIASGILTVLFFIIGKKVEAVDSLKNI